MKQFIVLILIFISINTFAGYVTKRPLVPPPSYKGEQHPIAHTVMTHKAVIDECNTDWELENHIYRERNSKPSKYKITINSPILYAKCDSTSVQRFNYLVNELITHTIAAYKKKLPLDDDDLKDFPPELRKNYLYVSYNYHFIRANHHLLSIRFITKRRYFRKIYPEVIYHAINYDLETGQIISLKSLFARDSNYVDRIYLYTKKILLHKLTYDMQWFPWEKVDNTSQEYNPIVWNLRRKGILFTFTGVKVDPYSTSPQFVLVPYSVLSPVIPENSVIATLG